MVVYLIIFYFSIFALILNNILTKKYEKKIIEIIILIGLCLISGTRYKLGGTDYFVYEKMFNAVPIINDFNFDTVHDIYGTFGAEKGYLYLNSIIKSLGFNFFGFTLIHSIFFYFSLYKGLKNYTYNFNLLIIVFIYKMFFYNTFISMRQSITIGIFFLAMHYIQEKKIVKYFAMCFIATFFHNGAFILFLVYFINKFHLTKKMLIKINIFFIPTIFLSIINFPILNYFNFIVKLLSDPTLIDKTNSLVYGGNASSIGIFHTLEYFLIMFLVIHFFEEIISLDKNVEFILKLFVILLPLFTLFRGYEILTRFKDYFIMTYPIILGYLCMIDEKKMRKILQIGTVSVCLFGYIRYLILFDGGALMPYSSYLFKGISIFAR